VAVSINPRSVTVETNQLIRFFAHGTTAAGDTAEAPVLWSASGGTILSDGRFSSAYTGTFMVLASSREREEGIDTAIVQVVRRQPKLQSISISPGSTSLTPGLIQTFLATGYLKNGNPVPVGVRWTATGGTIDAGGTFIAGDTAGTYQVIGTNTHLPISDTAVVTIGAPAAPPPPPPPPSEPAPAPPPPTAPILEQVTLVPASATLAPSTTRQFAAYGRLQGGDSVAVNVVFTATGGSITAGGLFTAGSTAGSYRVIASSNGLADTSSVTVTQPLGSGPGSGIAFGPYNALTGTGFKSNTQPFTATIGSVSPTNIITQIDLARSRGVSLILAMTGGGHENYLTNGVFDMAKWQARMDAFNNSAVKTAVAAAVTDGTIIGNSVMDEPNVYGLGDGNTWGPQGTMTKARVDQMCGYVKNIFPTLPVGVVHGHGSFEPSRSYAVCEFLVDQYAYRKGDVFQFRDEALAMGKRDGIAIVFSMNILNGGIQAARDGLWNCPLTTTGGRGTYDPNCRMTPAQVREWGTVLGSAGCAMMMWRYDDVFMANPENQQAFKDVAARLASLPGKSCRRV
jgi:hypothetical protein